MLCLLYLQDALFRPGNRLFRPNRLCGIVECMGAIIHIHRNRVKSFFLLHPSSIAIFQYMVTTEFKAFYILELGRLRKS
jgi:hypothetical protein